MTILDKIAAYKRDEIAAAKAQAAADGDRGARQSAPTRRAAFAPHLDGARTSKRIRPDRRDQEGQPVQGPDPRRFRSAGAGARL